MPWRLPLVPWYFLSQWRKPRVLQDLWRPNRDDPKPLLTLGTRTPALGGGFHSPISRRGMEQVGWVGIEG